MSSSGKRWLTIRDVMADYGLSRSAAYALGRYITRYHPPGMGVRYDRSEIEGHIRRYRRTPDAQRDEFQEVTPQLTSPMHLVDPGDPHRHGL